MTTHNPFIVTHMTRALSSKSEIKHSLEEVLALVETLRNDEEVTIISVMEWCPLRDRYSVMRNIPGMH